MTNLTVSAQFTKNNGQPATGLTLSDITLFLTSQDKSTGIDTTVWDGTQVATIEINNVGMYTRILATADLTVNDYFAMAQYVGGTVLDSNYAYGRVSMVEADVIQIEEVDATDQIRDAILTDSTPFDGANIATILAAVDTEIATLIANIATILAAVDTEVASIKAKTDNLPTDPADESNILAAIAALNDPSTADIVTAIFTGIMEGLTFEEIVKDIWAQIVGDAVSNDAANPTQLEYDGPDGAVQVIHNRTATTRTKV